MAFTYCPYCAHGLDAGQVCPHCGQDPGAYQGQPHHFPAGAVLANRYHILRVLGEGGFGITYLGFDAKLERRVAVKEYFPAYMVHRTGDETAQVTCMTRDQEQFEKGRDQFLKEARTLAKVDNISSIVRVMDYFPANGTAYIIMEYLEGETLKQKLKREGPMSVQDLLRLMEPVMDGLEELHGDGMIHRDISPDNLMILKKNGRVKLMDFGCARDIGSDKTMTVMLKPGFAPFEQYSGHEQGPWTDIYALCATMYYCITGKLPPTAIYRTEEDELVAPSALGITITPAQEAALMKGMAIWRKERWQSVAQMRAAMTQQAPALDVNALLEQNRKLGEQVFQMQEQATQDRIRMEQEAKLAAEQERIRAEQEAQKAAEQERIRRENEEKERLRKEQEAAMRRKQEQEAARKPIAPAPKAPASQPEKAKPAAPGKRIGIIAAAAVLAVVICVGLFVSRNGWKMHDNGTYSYYSMGFKQKEWKQIDGQYYYFDDNGLMCVQWKIIDGKYHYFGNDGRMRTGWQNIGAHHYYFGNDGRMRTGWHTINGNRYHFASDGSMHIGWKVIDGETYFFGDDGVMFTGWWNIDGIDYYFNENGILE